ncbi:MAG: glycosyltransferase family 4 protein [Myxococcota bacterium]
MRIALVHRRFTTSGGTERWLVGFARFCRDAGHDVAVLCNEVRPDLRDEATFVHLPMLRPAKLATLWASARRALARGGFDAVMGFGRTPGHHVFRAGGGSHLDYLRRAHPVRRWVSPEDWAEVAMDRAAVRSARVVLANSRLAAEGLARDYGARRVEVVYNGVDLDRFRPDPAAKEGKVALFLGTGFARKGLDVAIAALPAGWRLRVVGRDRPWAAPPHVEFLGERHDPERLLQAADVMILPTRYDPFANSCLEALACGVPALTTPANGAAEVLPLPWMTCRGVEELRAAFDRVGEPGLADLCRATAERFPPARSYARSLEILQEAAHAS